jgi:hypothetical protein
MMPLTVSPMTDFDQKIHKIDKIAQQYLEKASKTVQHLVPLEALSDGNCLFNPLSA